jgi:hypothetical protein
MLTPDGVLVEFAPNGFFRDLLEGTNESRPVSVPLEK